MNIDELWRGFRFPKCETCERDCRGHLDYNNLCSNVNYLREYGERNFKKNKESFEELKRIIGENAVNVFSFGCGLGLDYIGAVEVFGNSINYFGIEECNWAIKETDNYKKVESQLSQTVKFDDGMFLLTAARDNAVLCFFNSLYTISNNTDALKSKLCEALQNKKNFYIVCDYTINNNYHMPKEEQDFIKSLLRKLSTYFQFQQFEILDGRGIIISATR